MKDGHPGFFWGMGWKFLQSTGVIFNQWGMFLFDLTHRMLWDRKRWGFWASKNSAHLQDQKPGTKKCAWTVGETVRRWGPCDPIFCSL